MTYRYAVASGLLIGILGGLIVEGLAWWTYTGRGDWSVAGFLLIVLGLLAFVVVGRYYLGGRTEHSARSHPSNGSGLQSEGRSCLS